MCGGRVQMQAGKPNGGFVIHDLLTKTGPLCRFQVVWDNCRINQPFFFYVFFMCGWERADASRETKYAGGSERKPGVC